MDFLKAQFLGAGIASLIFVGVFAVIVLVLPRPFMAQVPGEVPLKPGVDGAVETYYWVGTLKERQFYRNGIAEGEWVQYYPNGSVMRRMMLSRGVVEGPVLEFYELPSGGGGRRGMARSPGRDGELGQGPPKGERNYAGGKRHGPYRTYYLNGSPREEGECQEGKLLGKPRKYPKTGKSLIERAM